LAVYLAAGLLLRVADASLTAAGAGETAHVEAASGPNCPAPHDESQCQLCQNNGTRFAIAHRGGALAVRADVGSAPLAGGAPTPPCQRLPSRQPRGPPVTIA
jgi:hypothetical protein